MNVRLPISPRSQYPVLTFTVAALVVFGLCKVAISPFLRPSGVNGLTGANDQFLQQGESEAISWHRLTEENLAKAKREDKLILLFMGTPWSTTARRIDQEVFQDETTDKYLTRNFECIRVDLDQNPSFFSSFLPVLRVQSQLNPICQLVVLSPSGKLISVVGRNGVWAISDAQHFLDELIQVSNQYRTAEAQELAGQAAINVPGALQLADFQSLSTPGAPSVGNQDLVNLVVNANQFVVPESGTGGVAEFRTLSPLAWQYLLLEAGADQTQTAILPLLKSSSINWIDGGFFWGSAGTDWQTPCYDQPAVPNAEMALLLAKLAVLTGDPVDRYIATKTIHSLVTQFVGDSGLIRTSRIGDESFQTFRSQRYSFSPERLRGLFPKESDREWVWNELGLRVDSNPIMVPRVAFPATAMANLPYFESILDKMRQSGKVSFYEVPASSGVNGLCIESLYQATQILDDKEDSKAVSGLFVQLTHFKSGSMVIHALGDSTASPDLVDYLGFAAASMADFQSTGRVESLDQGAQVLNYALATFPSPTIAGLPAAGLNLGAISQLAHANSPQLCDDSGESTSALVIRLCHVYGQALAASGDPKTAGWAHRWSTLAVNLSQRLTPLAANLGIRGGGEFLAQALALDGRFAVAVGPNPPNMARTLRQAAPLFPVLPAIGPVWPKLQGANPGFYVWANGQFSGPYTLSQAASRLNGLGAQGSATGKQN